MENECSRVVKKGWWVFLPWSTRNTHWLKRGLFLVLFRHVFNLICTRDATCGQQKNDSSISVPWLPWWRTIHIGNYKSFLCQFCCWRNCIPDTVLKQISGKWTRCYSHGLMSDKNWSGWSKLTYVRKCTSAGGCPVVAGGSFWGDLRSLTPETQLPLSQHRP